MIEGFYLEKKFSYDGKIESIGEYPSERAEGYMVWMGKTDFGFVYACYKDGEEPLVLGTTNAEDMLRFLNPLTGFDAIRKYLSKDMKIPESITGLVAMRAQQLREDNGTPHYYTEEFKKMVESL